jgi:hypothetical protein
MKKRSIKSIAFVGKSLLWSVLLYMTCMFVFNWDEVSVGFKQYRNGNIAQSRPLILPDSIPQVSYNVRHSIITAAVKIGVEQIAKAVTGLNK